MQTLSPLAVNPAPPELLVDVTQLERAYFDTSPDVEDPNQLVHFGTQRTPRLITAGFNEFHPNLSTAHHMPTNSVELCSRSGSTC
jgi:hypothetical protein